MSEARPIGEILQPILRRCAAMAGFQKMINDIDDPVRRKEFILIARLGNLITDEEATMLLQVYQLETA